MGSVLGAELSSGVSGCGEAGAYQPLDLSSKQRLVSSAAMPKEFWKPSPNYSEMNCVKLSFLSFHSVVGKLDNNHSRSGGAKLGDTYSTWFPRRDGQSDSLESIDQ